MKVTAVEMNPLMLRFVRHFGARAGNLYDPPQVEAILSEGRTFIRHRTIGMSGNRLALTLLHELKRRGGGIGAVALCGGGGQGDAAILRTV